MARATAIRKESFDKRARLLEASLALFETRGFDGVAVPEIARAAEVATGTVYLYFKDKRDLVNALYRHWKQAYNDAVLQPLPPGLLARDAFAEYWSRMMRFARAHPSALRFLDLHHHGAYLDDDSRALSRDYACVAEHFVRAARAQGAIRDVAPLLVVALMWGAAAGLVKFASAGAFALDAEAATAMEDALWRAIANDNESEGQGA